MVWKSRLPTKKKLAIIFMFSGAFLEMTFGILRAVAILQVCKLRLASSPPRRTLTGTGRGHEPSRIGLLVHSRIFRVLRADQHPDGVPTIPRRLQPNAW